VLLIVLGFDYLLCELNQHVRDIVTDGDQDATATTAGCLELPASRVGILAN
jgi:hypothetical protein